MSLYLLATGVLHADPVSRTGQSGKEFTTARLRIEVEGATTWASVICFDEAAQEELLQLRAGDAVSVQGRAKLDVYEKDGVVRPSLNIVANGVLSNKPKSKSKSASTPRRQSTSKNWEPVGNNAVVNTTDFDDPIDF